MDGTVRLASAAARRWLGNVVALAMAGLACLVLGEGMARIYLGIPELSGRPAALDGVIAEYDPRLGTRLLPSTRVTFAGPEFETTIRTNAHRLRESEETPYARTPGVRRILLCGDSFTFGHGVNESDRFGERLSQVLERSEVVNMGVWGTGTDQQLLLYRDEGVKYEPDLVVLAYFVDNVRRNGTSTRFVAGGAPSSKPQFLLEDGELVLTNVPVPKPRVIVDESEAEREQWTEIEEDQGVLPIPFKPFLRRHSALYDVVHARFARPVHRAVEGEAYVDGRPEWEVTKALIRAFRDDARDAGSEFLIVVIPDAPAMKRGTEADAPYREIEAFCAQDSIPLLNPLAEFRAAAERGETLYYRCDGHWTPAGHALMADLLAQRLRRDGW